MSPTDRHGFYVLPSEMVLEILSYLGPTDFVNFVFSNYDLLCHHGLAPRLSVKRLAALLAQDLSPGERRTPLHRLPTELLIYTMSKMSAVTTASFVLAQYQHLRSRGIAPPLRSAISPQFGGARDQTIRGGLSERGL